MKRWVWQVRMIDGTSEMIEASDAQLNSGQWHFINTEQFKLQSERTGPWPWSKTETVVTESSRQLWVTTINAAHVVQVTPTHEVVEEESGTEEKAAP